MIPRSHETGTSAARLSVRRDLYRECLSQGIPLNELIVRYIHPENLEESLEIEASLDV
jgi:hypothetical protein